MRRLLLVLGTLAALAFVASCRTTVSMDKVFFEEVGSLSKEEIVARGDALAEKKKWEDARKYYAFVADSFPNDPVGREAALKIADTFFRRTDIESRTEAQLRYKDFVNRFPNDSNRPYALLMLAKTYSDQQRGAQRDLSPLKEALASYRQLLELYPDSEYTAEASVLAQNAIDTLANHELEVAEFYKRIGALLGAQNRLYYLLENYPSATRAEEARTLLAQIRDEFAARRGASAEKPDSR